MLKSMTFGPRFHFVASSQYLRMTLFAEGHEPVVVNTLFIKMKLTRTLKLKNARSLEYKIFSKKTSSRHSTKSFLIFGQILVFKVS